MDDKNDLRMILEALKKDEIGLNGQCTALLNRAPDPGDWAGTPYPIDPEDLVWLAAKTGDHFAVLRGSNLNFFVHGDESGYVVDRLLLWMLSEGKLHLVATCRPGDMEPEIEETSCYVQKSVR